MIRTASRIRSSRLAALDSHAILDALAEPGFDDIVQLACELCAVPVPLVSLIAGDRQWFEECVGFPRRETDLCSSVCVHALARSDEVLVIPDLAADPRTSATLFVTGKPFTAPVWTKRPLPSTGEGMRYA